MLRGLARTKLRKGLEVGRRIEAWQVNKTTRKQVGKLYKRMDSKMKKIGLVGCGFIGSVHYNAYCRIKGAKVVAVCDQDYKRAESLLQGENPAGNISTTNKNPISFNPASVEVYTDLKEMLKNPQIDIIDVCLPTYMHKEAVIKSAEARKHIFCEKPMALSLKEADQMLAAVKKNKVKFMVAHVIRFWPEYVVLTEYISKKSLGDLLLLKLQRLSPTPTWTWNNWVLDSKKSLSAALDLHIHDTDYILNICGKPKAVSSVGLKGVVSQGVDHIHTGYIYAGGPKVSAEGGWAYVANYPFRMAFNALFEKGAIEYDSMNCKMKVYEKGRPAITPVLPKGDGYLREIQYFLKCVETDRCPSIVTPKEARESLRITLAEINSMENGKPVVL